MVDRPPQPADDDNAKASERRRLFWRRAGIGLLVLGLVILLLACVLWIPKWLYPSLTRTDLRGVSDVAKVQELKGARLKLQNDARTTLLQGVGVVLVLTGAAIGASVTLRQIRETATANRNQLQLGEQGQVSDRYTRAVEQLGHVKAPVRLGALYSLEHVAQDNPEYRQTVVDVICAYLRMDYAPPARNEPGAGHVEQTASPAEDRTQEAHPAPGQDPGREELQVRQTAQRILAAHLRRPLGIPGAAAQRLRPSPQLAFWPGITLDLTGAVLVNLDFAQMSVVMARFDDASFQGDARFDDASFQWNPYVADPDLGRADAVFSRANFQGRATFSRATFDCSAAFIGATFQDKAEFDDARFQALSRFDQASFHGPARFSEATFHAPSFKGATFQEEAEFDEARFRLAAGFDGANFQDKARFFGVQFGPLATTFSGANFQGHAWFGHATFRIGFFDEATFQGGAGFDRAHFEEKALFRGAQVHHLDDPDLSWAWPNGHTVRPDPADPTRGTLVRAERAEEPEPAVPPSDPTDSGSGTG